MQYQNNKTSQLSEEYQHIDQITAEILQAVTLTIFNAIDKHEATMSHTLETSV
jgi:hypothetical protein